MNGQSNGTLAEELRSNASLILQQCERLFLDHSQLTNINKDSDFTVITGYPFEFQELSSDGKRLQRKLLADYNSFYSILTGLADLNPPSSKVDLQYDNECMLRWIQQDECEYSNTDDLFRNMNECIQEHLTVLEYFEQNKKEIPMLVVDSNALFANYELSKWEFSEFEEFVLILPSTVLVELDSLKVDSRKTEEFRNKAKKIVRQIKEYRRRGKLSEGVAIVKGKIVLKLLAIEPRSNPHLDWIDLTNNDDRILYQTFQLKLENPNSRVYLVSEDINFQNKAEVAGISFLEPPAKQSD